MEFFLAEKGKPHVKSLHFRALVAAMSGAGTYIAPLYEQLKPELAANNVVKIRSGFLMHHGGIFFVQPNTYDEVTYMNGTQGMKRIDLIVGRYSKNEETGIEEGTWEVIQGEPVVSDPVAPAHTVGDMQNGDLVDECPLFELHFDGINVTEVKKLVPVTKNIEELTSENEDRKNEIAQLNGNTVIKPDITSSRVSNIDGGYVVSGNKVYVNINYVGKYDSVNTPAILSGFPKPRQVAVLKCIDISQGLGTAIEKSIPCGLHTTGVLYQKEIATNGIYALTGTYYI